MIINYSITMTGENCLFTPQQIVYLAHQSHRLYCEVIQVVESRQLCWVRPLCLVDMSQEREIYPQLFAPTLLMDVRSTSDLLYPIILFQPALDTEVIPLLSQLHSPDDSINNNPIAKEKLHQFITKVWQKYPELF
ncbi:conserved hypothetical protein [Crocosphaera subtropica ATCC 51142]|uniref:Uncharacterized protein n=2 Tax=Crocosphaera TaxID=263510 RepID=B1WYA9_CROS5|nr:conserved hypothetical protein [Crocosphaera subtropica ATCC 51142]